MKKLGLTVVSVLAISLAAACDGPTRTTPISPTSSPAGGVPTPPRVTVPLQLTGTITDESGGPVPGATVGIWGDYEILWPTQTDAAGGYRISFTAFPGSAHFPGLDPAGTENSVAIAIVNAPGYEQHSRHVIGTTPDLVENIQLQAVKRISAGESAVLTMTRDAALCILDFWPGREFVCSRIRVVASTDGVMTVEAITTPAGIDLPRVDVSPRTGPGGANPSSIPVTAQSEYFVAVQLPWGFNGSRSFVVKTSMDASR